VRRKAGNAKGVELLRKAYKVRSKQLDEINLVSPWHHLYREVTLPKLLQSMPSRRAKVLDAGGGTGNLASDLAKRGYAVTLVDVLPDMIAVARSRAAITPFEIFEGNLEDLSFLQAGSFDAIVCTQVLNFCADLGRVFKEFARVLRPSGVLFADIDNAYRWAAVEALSGHLDNAQRITVSGRDEARNIIGTGYFFHSEKELRGLLSDAGLTVQAMWGVGYIAPLIHVFAESKRFLKPSRLPARARIFADPKAIKKLARLESELARRMPLELAGWSQFLCKKGG
jgi:2-polyprenyl-3-methyl-5-hydroxy-6-metoxy-1,4-benzoquinol methylase